MPKKRKTETRVIQTSFAEIEENVAAQTRREPADAMKVAQDIADLTWKNRKHIPHGELKDVIRLAPDDLLDCHKGVRISEVKDLCLFKKIYIHALFHANLIYYEAGGQAVFLKNRWGSTGKVLSVKGEEFKQTLAKVKERLKRADVKLLTIDMIDDEGRIRESFNELPDAVKLIELAETGLHRERQIAQSKSTEYDAYWNSIQPVIYEPAPKPMIPVADAKPANGRLKERKR